MEEIKKEILTLLQSVKRPGIDEMIKWLLTTDFFESPSSTKYHGNYKGGLAAHSLNVFDCLSLLNSDFRDKETQYSDETIIVAAITHDFCKICTYIEDSEHATGAQLTYLKDLISKSDYEMPPEGHRTKNHVSKVIEYLKNGNCKEPFPVYSTSYKVEDKLPMGHGEKSVYLIQKFIDLTDDEALAIRWHLGANDPGTAFFYPSGVAINQAISNIPLVPMLVSADYLATWLVDVKK